MDKDFKATEAEDINEAGWQLIERATEDVWDKHIRNLAILKEERDVAEEKNRDPRFCIHLVQTDADIPCKACEENFRMEDLEKSSVFEALTIDFIDASNEVKVRGIKCLPIIQTENIRKNVIQSLMEFTSQPMEYFAQFKEVEA